MRCSWTRCDEGKREGAKGEKTPKEKGTRIHRWCGSTYGVPGHGWRSSLLRVTGAGSRIMTTQRVILAGGSGFIGQSLAADLCARGCEVVVLTCSPRPNRGGGQQVFWE